MLYLNAVEAAGTDETRRRHEEDARTADQRFLLAQRPDAGRRAHGARYVSSAGEKAIRIEMSMGLLHRKGRHSWQ